MSSEFRASARDLRRAAVVFGAFVFAAASCAPLANAIVAGSDTEAVTSDTETVTSDSAPSLPTPRWTTPTTAPTTTVAPPVPGTAPPVVAPDGTAWQLTFSEEFDGPKIDRNKWTPCFSWAWSYDECSYSFNNGREHYVPEQVRVQDGVATLVAEPDEGLPAGKTYRSGLLSTTNRPRALGRPESLFRFRYGYVEGRLRLPSERGMLGAFWMLPPTPGYAYPYEIDIVETMGGGDAVSYMSLHHTNRAKPFHLKNGKGMPCPLHDYAGEFHTYGVDWQPTHVDWYIDGRRCGRFSGPIWDGDMELIVNLMVDVDWQRNFNLGLIDPTTRGQLDVDYVKVWQLRPAP